jgi:soluble cytochrome b562
VGSGHFLVSALNEIIAIKSELGVLNYRDGSHIQEYIIEIENDELIITESETGELFDYHLNDKGGIIPNLQKMQETLFYEKQTIIENCLFGVDINPNSVNICRLRLWIELLKDAYYIPETMQLETLPNIDINIKQGNSLISRYGLDADIKTALKKSKWSVDSYRAAVMTYRNAGTKEEKREMEGLINTIKGDFVTEISKSDKRFLRKRWLTGELSNLQDQFDMFGMTDKEKEKWEKDVNKIAAEIKKLETEIEEVKSNKIYENADYKTYTKGSDIYCIFYEKGNQILSKNGLLTFITSNSWLKSICGEPLKKYFTEEMHPVSLLNIEDIQLFGDVTVESNITILKKEVSDKRDFYVCVLNKSDFAEASLSEYVINIYLM